MYLNQGPAKLSIWSLSKLFKIVKVFHYFIGYLSQNFMNWNPLTISDWLRDLFYLQSFRNCFEYIQVSEMKRNVTYKPFSIEHQFCRTSVCPTRHLTHHRVEMSLRIPWKQTIVISCKWAIVISEMTHTVRMWNHESG